MDVFQCCSDSPSVQSVHLCVCFQLLAGFQLNSSLSLSLSMCLYSIFVVGSGQKPCCCCKCVFLCISLVPIRTSVVVWFQSDPIIAAARQRARTASSPLTKCYALGLLFTLARCPLFPQLSLVLVMTFASTSIPFVLCKLFWVIMS